MALTPRLQLLTSPPEGAGVSTEPEDGGTKARRHSGPYLEGTLYRWAEYHQNQFRRRLAQQRLGTFDLSILNGKALQEGSTTQEYREFLRALETVGTRPQAPKVCTPDQTSGWLALLGNGCLLLLVCWLGGQPWYHRSRILGTRGSSISLGMSCKAIYCGIAKLLAKPDYNHSGAKFKPQRSLQTAMMVPLTVVTVPQMQQQQLQLQQQQQQLQQQQNTNSSYIFSRCSQPHNSN